MSVATYQTLSLVQATPEALVSKGAFSSREQIFILNNEVLKATGYEGEIEFTAPQADDVTSTWFDQNEFITT